MSISIIIPWCNRQEIKKTLSQNKSIFQKYNVEIIIVNHGGDTDKLDLICKDLSISNLKTLNLKSAHFNKCTALNIGAYKARFYILFFLDADIILRDDFLVLAIEKLSNFNFLTIERVFESNKEEKENKKKISYLNEVAYFTELTSHTHDKVLLETNRVRFTDGSRSAPGLLLIYREHFIKIDGMNSSLEHWGWEDLDLIARLQLALGLSHQRLGSVTHLSHEDNVRNLGGKSRSQNEMTNFSLCLSNYIQGQYKGTYSQDIEEWKDKMTEINFN